MDFRFRENLLTRKDSQQFPVAIQICQHETSRKNFGNFLAI